jgi:hypothetical protein
MHLAMPGAALLFHLPAAMTDVSDKPRWSAHHEPVVRYVSRDDRSGSHKGKSTYGHIRQND